jgi:uncharacterized ParB-like nuclease family protein
MYNDPSCKPWTSHKWAPPGYSSRSDQMRDIRTAEARKPLAKGTLEEDKVKDMAEMGKGRKNAPVGNEKSSNEVAEGDGTHV